MINLLFQVKNNDFKKEIHSKPYSKYIYQSVSKGSKPTENETYSLSINRFSPNHIYGEHSLIKRGYYVFCFKKS